LYNATVTNLIIENANITASSRAGALAGASQLSKVYRVKVVNSSIRVTYNGSGYGGGLIGDVTNGTEIEECAVRNTTVSGVKYAIGGLLGQLKFTDKTKPVIVKNCYVEGGQVSSDTSSSTASGGFICNCNITDASAAQVVNNYAAVKVVNGGGFIGYVPTSGLKSGVSGAYFDKDVANTTTDAFGVTNGVNPEATSEMKQQATFSGWDFTNVWTINEGNDYPRLKWEN